MRNYPSINRRATQTGAERWREQMTKPTTFTAAMKDFFGLLPEQKLMEFAAELKTLSVEDREYFRKGLVQNGYPIPETASAA